VTLDVVRSVVAVVLFSYGVGSGDEITSTYVCRAVALIMFTLCADLLYLSVLSWSLFGGASNVNQYDVTSVFMLNKVCM